MRHLHPSVLRVFQIAMAAGLLALLWHVADGQEALAHIASADPRWLAAGFAALTLQTVLSALRWRLTAGQLGIRFDRVTALREYYLSQIINQALPGGVLGDAGRAVRARAQAGLMESSKTVMFERLAGQVALFALLFAALIFTIFVPGGLDLQVAHTAAPALFLALVLALVGAFWIASRIGPARIRQSFGSLGRDLDRVFFSRGVRWHQIWLSLGTALCNIAAFAFCAAAVGSALPVAATFVIVPLVLFAMVIPITVSGWGLREGAAAATFPLAGASSAEGLAASVAFGLVFLLAALPGLAFIGRAPAPGAMKS